MILVRLIITYHNFVHQLLNKDKTQCGKVKNGVLFLGYWITPNIISVPENKIALLLTRIAGIFTEY